MRVHAIGQPVMDGADFQIDALQGAERPFHLGQTFVGADRIPGPDRLFGQARTDDVKAVKPGFGGDFVLFAAEGEAGVLDGQFEVLGHLALADDRAYGHANFVLSRVGDRACGPRPP